MLDPRGMENALNLGAVGFDEGIVDGKTEVDDAHIGDS